MPSSSPLRKPMTDDEAFGIPSQPMTDDEAFGTQQQSPVIKTIPMKPSLGEKFGMGAGDVVRGIAQALARAPIVGEPGTQGIVTPMDYAQRGLKEKGIQKFDKSIAKRESDWQARRSAGGDTGIEWMRGIGAGVASAPIAAMLPQTSSGLLPSIATGMLQGGALALTNPVTDTSKGYGAEKLKQGAFGMGVGGLVSGISDRIGAAVSPKVDAAVQYLRDRGVNPTVGQNLGELAAKVEDASTSVNPFAASGQKRAIEQLNVAAYNEALKPLAEATGTKVKYSGNAGPQAIKKVGDLLSNGYNKIKEKIALPVDDATLTSLGEIATEAAVTTKDVADKFQRFISKDVLARVDDSGVLTGKAFKDAESALLKRARDYAKSTVGDDRTLATHLFDAVTVLRDSLAERNPDQATILQALNKGWAMLTRIESAAAKAPATNKGVFTPAQLSRTVQMMDDTVRHRGYLRGEALLGDLADAGSKVLGNSYPNSGTASRYILGSALLGGTAAINPTAAITMGAGGLAYTPWGQRAAGAILNDRPNLAPELQKAIRLATPALVSGAIFGSRQQ